jgi:hypothetical protein
VPAGEAQDQPPVGRHQRVAVDVPPELVAVGVLAPLVLQRHLPLRVAQVGVRHLATPPVVHRHLQLRVGQVAGRQPVADEALRPRRRPPVEPRGARTGTDDAPHAVGPLEAPRQRRGVHLPAAHERVTDRHQLRGGQPGGEVEEGLRARRQRQPADHDDVLLGEEPLVDGQPRAPGQLPPRGDDDVHRGRLRDRRPVQPGRRPQAEGGVAREHQPPGATPGGEVRLDGGGEVEAAADADAVLGDLPAGRAAGPGVVPGVGRAEVDVAHAGDRRGLAARVAPAADICGRRPRLWTP